MSTAWQRSSSTLIEDPFWLGLLTFLVVVLAVAGLDRATEHLDQPRTSYGTVIADDPESAATTTSGPGQSR